MIVSGGSASGQGPEGGLSWGSWLTMSDVARIRQSLASDIRGEDVICEMNTDHAARNEAVQR